MSDQPKPSKVDTEGSARVLNEVKGRLERMDTGELPVIERVGPDGSSRRVDPTGEMIRPDVSQVEAASEAGEAFATEHRPAMAAPASDASTMSNPGPASSTEPEAPRKGLWARIMAWFGRS